MNDEKKETKNVQKSGSGTAVAVVATLFSGLALGFITGILFAPKKGQKTRKEIVDKSKELLEKSKQTVNESIDKTKEFTKESKGKFEKVVGIIAPKKKNKK